MNIIAELKWGHFISTGGNKCVTNGNARLYEKLRGVCQPCLQDNLHIYVAAVPQGNKHREYAGRTNPQMIVNCGLMPFQDIRAETGPCWGYKKKHGRGLQLRYPGRARVPHLTEWNGHHGAKIQTHGSWCGAAKPGTASGNAPITAGASRGTLGGRKTISPRHQRLQMLGDSPRCDCTSLPRASGHSYCSARGCSPHRSNPLIQTLWRITGSWSVSNPVWLHHHITGSHRGREKDRLATGRDRKQEGQAAQMLRKGGGRVNVPSATLILCKKKRGMNNSS